MPAKLFSIPFLTALIMLQHSGVAQMRNVADGPYVFYHGGKVDVITIRPKDSTAAAAIESYAERDKLTQTIPVTLSGLPDKGFTFRLHPISNEASTWETNDKILAVSDIEGEFAGFRTLLIGNKVIDEDYNWTFGAGHLVICGDLFDRGRDVIPLMWLLYKLENDATAHGGHVHVILGNHEIMNLSGDFRYVTRKYFLSAHAMGIPYNQVFDIHSELGRWLRSKNIVEQIGGILFLHAGVSPQINGMGMSIKAINQQSRPYFAFPLENVPANMQDYFNENSPFWYRGYFDSLQHVKVGMSEVDSTLRLFKVNQIIVGHSLTDQVSRLYNGKVYSIDVNTHAGLENGLLIENGKFYRVDANGTKTELKD